MISANAIDKREEHFPIRTVAAITGVNPVTLRAWERRYGLITPVRTPKGHRLYTHRDIALINRILRLLERGIAISQVHGSLVSRAVRPAEDRQHVADPWSAQQADAIEAITRFDEIRLDQIYNQALANYPVDIVTEHLLTPLLVTLGDRWETTEGSVAEEHFFSAFMRNKLGARFHHRHQLTAGKKLLVTCLQGEQHEFGALLFSIAAHDHGFRIVYLGPDMPLEELALAAGHAGCDAIALSGLIDPDDTLLENELPELVSDFRNPVFVGGQTSVRCSDAIERAGAVPVGTGIRSPIKRIEQILGK